ncbi:MAG: hypothetical protein IKD69_07860 [Solobacterium sp.]|nr:hypothetical protein [Solobacterium sp.]
MMTKQLPAELKVLLDKAKEGIQELSSEDLNGVAGGLGNAKSISLLDPANAEIAENVRRIALGFKVFLGCSREDAINQIKEVYLEMGYDLYDINDFLTPQLWDTLQA